VHRTALWSLGHTLTRFSSLRQLRPASRRYPQAVAVARPLSAVMARHFGERFVLSVPPGLRGGAGAGGVGDLGGSTHGGGGGGSGAECVVAGTLGFPAGLIPPLPPPAALAAPAAPAAGAGAAPLQAQAAGGDDAAAPPPPVPGRRKAVRVFVVLQVTSAPCDWRARFKK